MGNENAKKGNIDIFITNDVYPEALPIFNAKFKSVEEIKEDCIIVIDTNALLLPYKTSNATLKEIENTYKKLIKENRLIVPGQVVREFARNRATKLTELYQLISDKRDGVKLPSKGDFYPLLESLNIYKEARDLEQKLHDIRKKYNQKIGEILEYIKKWNWNDPVSSLYAELFTQDVILDLDLETEESKKEEIKEDLKRRYSHKIPPGYKDVSKPDEGIGDLLIWYTILDLGKRLGQSVIFVSGEEKPDWWHRSKGEKLYPRYELVDEFRRESKGHSFHMIDFAELLKLYGASEEIVEEVKEEERVLTSISEAERTKVNNVDAEEVNNVDEEVVSVVYGWLNNQNKYQRLFVPSKNVDFGNIIAIDFNGETIHIIIKVLNSIPFRGMGLSKLNLQRLIRIKKGGTSIMVFIVCLSKDFAEWCEDEFIAYTLNHDINFPVIIGYLVHGKFQSI